MKRDIKNSKGETRNFSGVIKKLNIMKNKMKSLNFSQTALRLLLASCIFAVGLTQLNAQTKTTAKNTAEPASIAEDDTPASYLDIFHSKERAYSLKRENMEDIHRLKVIVTNFGDANHKTMFENIMKSYKEGVKVLYKNRFIDADKQLTQNKSDIIKLYALFAMEYHTKTNELLNDCADKLVDVELAESIEPGSMKTSKNRIIVQNRNRLQVAYSQLNMGADLEKSQNLPEAVAHFRVAKYHGIKILMSLTDDENEKKKIDDQYQKDMIDVDNRTVPKEKAKNNS